MLDSKENEFNYIYLIPELLFDDDRFSKTDIKIYARIRLLKHGLGTTYARFSDMIGVSELAIKRAIPKFLATGWLIRHGNYIKCVDQNTTKEVVNSIKIDTKQTLNTCVESIKIDTVEYQNGYSESINIDTSPNSINNNKINRERESGAPSFKFFKLGDEIEIGTARMAVLGFSKLALTYAEANILEEMLVQLKFDGLKQVELVLISANAISESSEARKSYCRSFLYIKSALDDLMKTRKISKDLQNTEARANQYNPPIKTNRADRKIIKAS